MNNELPDKKKQYFSSYIIFFGFFTVLLIQHSFVFMYMDDYGYASLSVLQNHIIPNVSGTHFTFSQFMDFLNQHYLYGTGRITADSLATATLSVGLWFARIVQSAVIILLVFMIYWIINHFSRAKSYLIAIVVCCLYGLLEIFMIDKSIVWFCASVCYVWSLLPLLFGLWNYYRYVMEEKKLGIALKVLTGFCLFWAASSQEQVAVAEIFIIAILFIIKIWRKRKISVFDIAAIACAVGGFLFLYLAPSEALRAQDLKLEPSYFTFLNMSLVQKTSFGFNMILQYIFSKNLYLFILALLSAGSYVGYRLIGDRRGVRILNIMLLIFCIGSITAMIFLGDGLYTIASVNGIPENIIILLLSVLIIFLSYGFTVYYYNRKNKFIIVAYYAAWISIFSILFVLIPGLGRIYIPFVFLSFLLIGDILCETITSIHTKQIKILMIVLLLLVVSFNLFNYTVRYYYASGVQIENDQVLRNVSEQIKNGEDVKSVNVKAYPNIESDSLQPNEGTRAVYGDTVIAWIKEYYDLPQSVVFNWALN